MIGRYHTGMKVSYENISYEYVVLKGDITGFPVLRVLNDPLA